VPLGLFGIAYLLVALVFGLWLLITDLRLAFNPTKALAWTAFKVSSPYLAIIFLAMIIDSKLVLH